MSKTKKSDSTKAQKEKKAKQAQNIVSEGDFVIVEYTARDKETNTIFDTTFEDVAKEAKIYKEGEVYGPQLLIVGEGWAVPGLEKRIVGIKEGETKVIEIPPEEGFGRRDPSKIEKIPLRRFRKEGIDPKPKMRVNINNRIGTVIHIGAGRVLVDFNQPLAGKTLVYELKVSKILKDQNEKIQELIKRRIPDIDIAKVSIMRKEKVLTINLPDEVLFYRGVEIAKRGIAQDIFKYFEDIEKVRYVEEVVKEKPVEKEIPKEEQ
ncbi:MAG: peptidylprolyl isomerase [Candidatus Odinarchaeota archaeon]|nr:peptidylprolyl isomerase [Candidatus Odinarchaeota archaeon]